MQLIKKGVVALAVFVAAALAATEEETGYTDAIVITVTGEPAASSEVPFGSAVVRGDDLLRADAADLAEGLSRVEGVFVREYGGIGANRSVSLRGAQSNQTLVMLDGQPLNNHQGGDVDFNVVSLEDVERVEVLSGPSSALYGANATAGVVNVITTGRPTSRYIRARSSYGSYETVNTGAAAGVPWGPAGLEVGGNYRRSAGFRENDDYKGTGGHAKASYGFGRDWEVSLRGQYQTGELGVPGSLTYPTPQARQEDDYWGLNAGVSGGVAEAVTVNVRGYYDDRQRHYVDPGSYVPTDDTHNNNGAGARALTFVDVAQWNRLGLGGEWGRHRTDSTVIGVQEGTTWAGFVQEDLRLGRFNAVAGCRYDSSGIYGDAVSPRVGIRYRLADAVSVRASVGKGFRAPTFDELFWPDTGWGGGNPDLKPEYAWTYEAGPAWHWGNRATAEITYYSSTYKDLINGWPPENVARAVIRGVEVDGGVAPLPFVPALWLAATGSYMATEDKETGERLYYRPEYTGFVEARYKWNNNAGWGLSPSVAAEAAGKQDYPYTDPQTFETSRRTLPGYVVANARIGAAYRGVEVFGAVKNITNREYQTVYDYPMPGRTLAAGVNFEF